LAVTWKKLAYSDDVILEAFMAAKGDLISASANDTPVILSVGSAGQFLSVDAGETTGLKWVNAPSGDVATDAIWEAAGDVAVGTGVATADVLNIGSDEDIMVVATDTPGWVSPATVAATMALDDIGVPDAAVDFNLQQATDLVVMTVANEAALPTTGIALGQLCWATSELTLHVCTAIA
jgi:hypothetical protein